MARSGPTSLTLPPFEGATRKLVLWNVVTFFAFVLITLIFPRLARPLTEHLSLIPEDLFHGQIWQLITYAFMPLGLVNMLFAMLTLWFCGSMLESAYGSRWLYELYFVSVAGGALLASAFTYTRLFHLDPGLVVETGPFAGIFGLLIAIGTYFGDQEFLLLFLLRLKARYMVAIYILIEVALLMTSANTFSAAVQLSGALCAFLFLRLAPRRGLGFLLSERLYSLRNDYYRAKRRRAAKKFQVYMRKQNREVHFDSNGKYVDPDEKGSSDKRWMN